jgi:CubicO group peptidase (beta-lactamase class C family)
MVNPAGDLVCRLGSPTRKFVETLEHRRFVSLLVTRHGKIVAEAYYYAPYAAGILHAAHSITKAVIGTLVGIVSEEGLLDNPSHRMHLRVRGKTIRRS